MNYPNGHDFDYKLIPPSQIRFDALYQREVDVPRVERIVKEFDGDTFNEPKVSYRDGAFWCFDGQHSIAAWRKLNKGENVPILCKVYHGMTWLDEANAFVKQNGIAKDPTTLQKLRTCYNSERQDVREMVMGAQMAGFNVAFTKTKNGRNIPAVGALFKAYQILGYAQYQEMLMAIAEAWQHDPDSTLRQILSGMTEFYHLYGGKFIREDLVARLKKVSPLSIIRRGKEDTGHRNGYCHEILRIYNRNRSTRRLEEIT